MADKYIKAEVVFYDLIHSLDNLDVLQKDLSLKYKVKNYLEETLVGLLNDYNTIYLSEAELSFYKSLDSLIKEKAEIIAEDKIENHCDSAKHEYYNY